MSVKELKRSIMLMPLAHHILALQLILFGYCGDVYAGAALKNSNAIKTLTGAGKSADTVSPSPRTSPPGGTGHRSPMDTLQVREHFSGYRSKLCVKSRTAYMLSLFFCCSSQVVARMMRTAEVMSSAMTPGVFACRAASAGSAV